MLGKKKSEDAADVNHFYGRRSRQTLPDRIPRWGLAGREWAVKKRKQKTGDGLVKPKVNWKEKPHAITIKKRRRAHSKNYPPLHGKRKGGK